MIGGLLITLISVILIQSLLITRAANPITVSAAWSHPSVMALKRIASVSGHQNEAAYLGNLDCTLETYRLTDSTAMQTGCFTDTAYGQYDADSNVIIFNGSDEGVHLLAYTPQQILAPWPKTLNLVSLVTAATDGTYISLYKNPLSVTYDQRNLLGIITAKQLTAGPDLPLKDSSGQSLIINPQSLAFSDNGSWMIMEVLGGSFVRVNLATLQLTPFAPIYARAGSPALDESSVTVSADGRYVAIENTYASEFKVYDLSSCNGDRCDSYNYWPFIAQQVSGLMYISHVRFLHAGLISFDASSNRTGVGGTYELAPTASIQSLIDYLGLGDSYSSGEGAFDYLAGTDTVDDKCHLSSHSYPLLLTHDLFTAAGGHSVACSGAVMHDVGDTSDGYRGQVRGVASWKDLNQSQPALLASILSNYLPGYVAQQRFVSQYQPGIITVGIGGNNVGFGNILERCIEPQSSLHPISNTCFATYEDRQELLNLIHKTGKGLQNLYKQLARESPSSRLYVIGYPEVSVDNGDCALNVHFNTSELEFVDELVDQINSTIAGAAVAAGAQYVDISKALVGHRLCETSSANIAVNGLTAGDDNGLGDFNFLGDESYHPNALGQQLIEQAILKQTKNLTLAPTTTPSTVSDTTFTNAPKSNRPIMQLLPVKNLAPSRASPGQTFSIHLNSLELGLAPSGSYSLHLDGSQGAIIGTLTGDGSANVTLPTDTSAGVHTIDITGQNQAGEVVDITQPISVTSGSGSPCGLVAASGIDVDVDGIDDACDASIGAPSAGPPNSTSGDASPTSDQTNIPNQHTANINPPSVDASLPLQLSSQYQQVLVDKVVLGREARGTLAPKPQSGAVNLRNIDSHTQQRHMLPTLKIIPWWRWLVWSIVCCICVMIVDGWLRRKQSI